MKCKIKRRVRIRLLVVALSFCLFVTTCPHMPGVLHVYAAVTTGTCGSNVTWSLDDDGTLTVRGNGAIDSGSWADAIRSDVKHVVIENGVSEIGSSAFAKFTALQSVTIPGSVRSLGNDLFQDCTALESATILNGVTTTGQSMFYGCTSLREVTLPTGLTTIGWGTFGNCKSLKSIVIPDTVTHIGGRGFYGCSALESVEIPDSVETLGASGEGITGAVFYNCTALKKVRLSNKLVQITRHMFNGCASLTSIEIPESVTEIYTDSFRGCSSLESVTVPDGVTLIAERAFLDCGNAVILYPDKEITLGDQWNDNTAASIKYTLVDDTAELFLVDCAEDCTEIHLPAMVSGNRPVSFNYEDYPEITVTHDGAHSFVHDICQLCGEISEEKKVADAMEVVMEAMEEIEATNATTQEQIQAILDAALEEAGIDPDDVTVIIADFEKIEAEKYEDGGILGTIFVVSNQDEDVYDGFEFELPIDELITDEEMVADAKKFVEKVLASIEATNATTREEIQKIIDEALDNEEYIYDVEITVGELAKTEADRTAPGSITGVVSIVSDNDESVTASVPVDLVIAKLPTPVTGVTLDRDSITLTKDGETVQLTAGVVPEDATNKTIIWSTDDAGVATVDATGKVSAAGNGTCTVTATTEDGGRTASCQVTVSLPAKTPSPTQTVAPGKTPAPGKTAGPDKTAAPDGTNPPAAAASPAATGKITPPKNAPVSNAAFLYGGLKVRQSGKKIVISWGKAAGADGYDVHVQYCGKKFTAKSIKAIRSGKTTKTTVTKINGKSLNVKKHFKVYVSAYKRVNGKKVKIGKTVAAHVVGSKAAGYANAKAIRVGKSSYRLKKGRSVTLRAKTVSSGKGRKQLSDAHTREFRYASDNKKVATVSRTGTIKAVGKGTCTIYIYARNGYARKVRVTV